MAAFATFKKDTTLERQGRFTLSTLQGGARAGERLNEPNDKPKKGKNQRGQHRESHGKSMVIANRVDMEFYTPNES